MLSLFKLKKKSKKDKDQNQDDEKENTSSPTKVKKVEKSSSSNGKKSKSKVLNENKQQKSGEEKSPTSGTPAATSTPSPPGEKLDTKGLDSPYKSSSKPLVVDVTTTPIVASSKSPKKSQSHHKVVEIVDARPTSEPSPGTATTSSSSAATNTAATGSNQPRAPVLSASDAAANNSNSFIRGNFLSSTISGSDLNRYLNSGYLHGGDSYLQKTVDPKYPKSPHFHRPPNFSFYRNIGPNYVVSPRRNANRVSSSSMSSNARSSRGQTMMNSTAKRVRSNSPPHLHVVGKTDEQIILTPAESAKGDEQQQQQQQTTTGEEPVTRINIDNEEPIRLSKFSGGYEPDPQTPRKIESLDWPAPPYPAAVPELRARSRSSSNRHAHSTVHSVNGEQCLDDSDEEDVEVSATTGGGPISVTIDGVTHVTANESTSVANSSNLKRPATKSASSSSSAAKPKQHHYPYQHHFFDNDYDDYLLQYRPHSEWRKHFEARYKPTTPNTTSEDVNNNSSKVAEVEIVEELEPQEKQAQEKLNREIEQISTLQNESSMAADLIKEIRAEQKMAHHKLKLDPWKASRTPSANVEPPIRTRFDSPVNASPSRVYFYNVSGSHRIPMTPSGHTISTSGHLQSSTTASTSFFSPGGATTHSAGSNSSTLIAGGGVGGLAVNSSSSNNAITNTQSINYGESATSSSAALVGAPPKSATLPVGTTSTPFYSSSSSSAAVSSQRAHTLSNASTSPTITANATTTPRAGLSNNIVYNIAVPKPGYGLSSPHKSVTLPNSTRYAGMPTHRSVDFERRAASPLYDSGLYSPPSPRTNYERSRFEHEMHLYSIIEQFVQLTKSTPNLVENPKVYPYETLRILPRKKLPADVDRQHLERHLSDDEFKQLFGVSLKEFYQMPYWKRVDMKKMAKLF